MEPRGPAQRVVITGMGVVTVLGDGVSAYWDALAAGRSGITRWKGAHEHPAVAIAGDLSDFDHEAHLAQGGARYPAALVAKARKLLRPTPGTGRITLPAALQAWTDAGLPHASLPPERFAHVMAGHNVNGNYIYQTGKAFLEEPEFIDPLYGMMAGDTDVLSLASDLLELRGPSFTVGGACASGNLALLTAVDLLRAGRADAVLVSAASNDLDPPSIHAWMILDALSFRSFNDEPERASRPFDARREGFVPSQGAGAVVLETLAGARARGARIRAEVVGVAAASDGSRQTRPDRDGQVRAMRGALEDARVAWTRWTTSTRTPPRRLSATRWRWPRSRTCSARARGSWRSTPPSRCSATACRRPASSSWWRRCCSSSTRSCTRRSTWTIPTRSSTSTSSRTGRGRHGSRSRCRTPSGSAA